MPIDKKIVVIWANCQGVPIRNMLIKYYNDLFSIRLLTNYEYINENKSIQNDFAIADILLYQNYSDKPNFQYNLKDLFDKYLKKDCVKICFPTLHSCPLLFCYDITEPNNSKTITNKLPYGKFYYRISVITDLLKKHDYTKYDDMTRKKIVNEIYEESQKLDFISDEKIKYYHDRNFEFLENKILTSNIPELLDFIKNNFTKVRLWSNPFHPTGVLLNELSKNIFRKLNLTYNDDDSIQNICELNGTLNDWVIPIFPSVKKYYNMDFEDKCSS